MRSDLRNVPIHPPQQRRSRASFERVLEASARLLEENGYEGFTLAEVSRSSGVSIGSIYARVQGKDDLFHAIQERELSRIAAEWHPRFADAERWQAMTTPELIPAVVRELGEHFRANAGLLRVVMHRGIVDERVAARSSACAAEFAELVERPLLTRRHDIAHADPELATDVAFRLAWSTFARRIMYGPTFESRRLIDWDTLIDEVGSACTAYLLGPRAPGAQAR